MCQAKTERRRNRNEEKEREGDPVSLLTIGKVECTASKRERFVSTVSSHLSENEQDLRQYFDQSSSSSR